MSEELPSAFARKWSADFVQVMNDPANKQRLLRVLNALGQDPVDVGVDSAVIERPVFWMRLEDGVEVRFPIQLYSEGPQH